MHQATDPSEAPLRPGFQKIPEVEGRRFRSTQFSEEIEVAGEITAPADMSGTLTSDRAATRSRPGMSGITPGKRMGADLGNDGIYLNAEHNELFFIKAGQLSQHGWEALTNNRAEGWTSFNGYPLNGIETNDDLRRSVQCIGININQVRYQMGNETEKQTSIRVAGAGSLKLTGNMPAEVGQGITFAIHSINEIERDREVHSLPHSDERPREKLCPILVPMREEDTYHFVNQSITTWLQRSDASSYDFSTVADQGRFEGRPYADQYGMGMCALAAFAGFATVAALSKAGLITFAGAGSLIQVADALGLTGNTEAINVGVVRSLCARTFYSALQNKQLAAQLGSLNQDFNDNPYLEDVSGFDAILDERVPSAKVALTQSFVGHKPMMAVLGAFHEIRKNQIMTALSNAGPSEDMQYLLTLA